MNKKKIKITILIVLILIIIGVIAYLYFFNRDTLNRTESINKITGSQTDQINEKESQMPIKSEPVKEEIKKIVYNESDIEAADTSQDDLKRMAAAFAERFGSYSNQSNYANIKDLQLFMTGRMQVWSNNYIREIKEQGGTNTIYYGVTTKAIYQEVKDYDDDIGKAEILVKTQRREATGTMANTSDFYQDIVIAFIKADKAWKVDSASWQ